MKEYVSSLPDKELFHYQVQQSLFSEFQVPSILCRPRIRWWLPSIYLSEEGIEYDIHSISEAGFGGAEIVPMPIEHQNKREIEWGTSRWIYYAKQALALAKKNGISIDFSMTPFWPLSLPDISDPSDPEQGAQMELDGTYIDGITREHPYCDFIPVSSEAEKDAYSVNAQCRLLAVTCAKYADKKKKILQYQSAKVLLQGKDVFYKNQRWYVNFCPEDEGEYVLFTWWEHPSGNKTCQNLQLDHYSTKATMKLIKYWENIIIPKCGEDFSNTVSMFIDSLEYETHLDWTPGFAELFSMENHYDLQPFLPALYDPFSSGCFLHFPRPQFQFDRENQQIINDYEEFLTRLYINHHIIPLMNFCRENRLNLRYQTSYGKNLELAQTAMYVTIPETETLYGADILDFYRIQSGSMHMAEQPIYSIEASAEMNGRGNGPVNSGNYQQTWGNQLWHIQRAMACGVNQIVFHGYSYEGFYKGEGNISGFIPGVHWPGYTTMNYNEFSNNWGPAQPNWIHAKQYTDFLGRMQLILRQGKAKIDIAIYRQSYEEIIDIRGARKLYDDGGILEQSGYSYEFISPSSIMLTSCIFEDNCINPNGPAYRAVIFNNIKMIPMEVASKLLEFAKKGLSIIFIGETPSEAAFHKENGNAAKIIQEVLLLHNVVQISSIDDVLDALCTLGIVPSVQYVQRAKILNVHRQDSDTDYYYFYNYANADTWPEMQKSSADKARVILHGASGIPVMLNAWNGKASPLISYKRNDNSFEIMLKLEKNESKVIAITEYPEKLGIMSPISHIEDPEVKAEYYNNQIIVKKNYNSNEYYLHSWDIEFYKWLDDATPNLHREIKKTYHNIDHLLSWKDMDVSEKYSAGIAIYHTSFVIENGWDEHIGYILKFKKICDSFRMIINGLMMENNQTATEFDIGEYLHKGENDISIEVASPLLNSLLGYYQKNKELFQLRDPDVRVPEEYGIMGDVTLISYEWINEEPDKSTVNFKGI